MSWADADLPPLLWPLCSQAAAGAGCSRPPRLVLSLHKTQTTASPGGRKSSITFQPELIYAWWETVQAASLLFCKLHTEEFMGLSNKCSLWAAPERTRVITLGKVQPEVAGYGLGGVPEARGQGDSGSSAPLSLPRASQGTVVLLGILLGSGNSDQGRGQDRPAIPLALPDCGILGGLIKNCFASCGIKVREREEGPLLQGRKN